MRTVSGRYEAQFERAVDGDTLILWIKVAADVMVRRRCRIMQIDSHEPAGDEAAAAADTARNIAALLEYETLIVDYSPDRCDVYGRALIKADWRGVDLAEIFIKNGWSWHFGQADRKKHASRRLNAAQKTFARVAAACVFVAGLALGCAQPSINYSPARLTPPTHAPRVMTVDAPPCDTTAPSTAAADDIRDARPVLAIVEKGGQLTITGNESPVSATDTNTTAARRATWRGYALALFIGAALALLIVVGCRLGWKAIFLTAKAAI